MTANDLETEEHSALSEGSELVDWKSTLVPVIPVEAGIQADLA